MQSLSFPLLLPCPPLTTMTPCRDKFLLPWNCKPVYSFFPKLLSVTVLYYATVSHGKIQEFETAQMSYLSHCCVKYPRKEASKKGFILPYGLRARSIITKKTWLQERQLAILSAVRKQVERNAALLLAPPCFVQKGAPAHEMVSPTLRVGLSTLTQSRNSPTYVAQRSVSRAILTLTTTEKNWDIPFEPEFV